MEPVVTLSASFGRVGRHRAGSPRLRCPSSTAPSRWRSPGAVGADGRRHGARRAAHVGPGATLPAWPGGRARPAFGSAPTASASLGDHPEQAFRDQTERVIHQVAGTTGGVILGGPRPSSCATGRRRYTCDWTARAKHASSVQSASKASTNRRASCSGDGPCAQGVREALLPVSPRARPTTWSSIPLRSGSMTVSS
jgi:hypothetical protein